MSATPEPAVTAPTELWCVFHQQPKTDDCCGCDAHEGDSRRDLCDIRVLVPVTQWDAEQRVIEKGRELATLSEQVEEHAVNHDCDGGCNRAITLWRKWSRSSGEMLNAHPCRHGGGQMKVTNAGVSLVYCDGDECTAIHPPGRGFGWETYVDDDGDVLVYCRDCAAWWDAEEAEAPVDTEAGNG